MEKAVLKNFVVFTGKFQACNFTGKRLQHRCFPVNIAKIFKNTYFEEYLLMAAWVFKTATEQRWATASVLTALLSLGNLSTGY